MGVLVKLPPKDLKIDKEIAELLPPLSEEDYNALKKDIEKRGIQVPLDVDRDTLVVYDGFHRRKIALELGIEKVPCILRTFKSRDEAKEYTLLVNLARRHMTTAEKYLVYAKLSKLYEKGRRTVILERDKSGRMIKVEHPRNANMASLGCIEKSIDVLEKTAEVVGESPRTIARARLYLKAIEKYPELKKFDSPLSVINEFKRREELEKRKKEARKIEETGDVELKNLLLGDCVEKIDEIPDNSIDAVITDPPYGIVTVGASGRGETRRIRGEDWEYEYQASDEVFSVLDRFFSKAMRKLKDDAHVYIFTNWRSWCRLTEVVKKYLEVKNCLIYYYGRSLGSTTFDNYIESYGMILFASNKKKRKLNSSNNANLLIVKRFETTHHPAEKSIEVVEWLVKNSTVEGETILDPFCGSGTTLVVAEKLKRNWYGIEIDPKWYEIAKMRILEVRRQMRDNTVVNSNNTTT